MSSMISLGLLAVNVADETVRTDSDAYRAGQIAAYVTMAAIGLYFLIKWLRNRP
jgi:hypothetical protein